MALALAAALGLIALTSDAEAQIIVPLGDAAEFAVLGATPSVTNTTEAEDDGVNTVITGGNVGISPAASITGFQDVDGGSGILVGGTFEANTPLAQDAQEDLTTAYNFLMALPETGTLNKELDTQVVIGGVYKFNSPDAVGANLASNGTLTLNGQNDPASQWIFQISGGKSLIVGSNSQVIFTNVADELQAASNVWWVVSSSASIGADAKFAGNILALTSITMDPRASLICGRALARNGTVTMIDNTITMCVPDNGEGEGEGEGGTEGGGNPSNDIPMDELGGEGVSGTQETAFDASRLFGSTMLAQTVFPNLAVGALGFGSPGMGPQANRPAYPEKYTPLKVGPSDSEPVGGDYYYPRRWRVWAAGLGGGSSLDDDEGLGTLDTTVGGVAGGLDYRFNSTALIGVAGGYTDSDLSVDAMHTDGKVQGSHVGLYGVKSFGRIYLAGTAEYAHFENQTDRVIDWVVDERAKGSFGSDSFGGRLEAGWRRSLGRHYITPFVGVDAYELDIDGFTENSQRLQGGGPGILGLTFASDSVTSVTSSIGIQFDTQYALANDRWLTPFVRVAWVHEYNPERGVQSSLTAAPAASFLVDGASAAEDVARVDAGLKLDLSERIALFGFFEGEFGDRSQSYAGVGGGTLAFAGSGEGQNYSGQNYSGRVGMKVRW